VDQHAQQRPKGGSASCNTHLARDDAIGSQHKKPMEGRQNSRSWSNRQHVYWALPQNLATRPWPNHTTRIHSEQFWV